MKLRLPHLFSIILCVLVWIPLGVHAGLNTAKLDSLLDIYEKKNKLMLSLSIHEKGSLVYSRAIGYADVDAQVKSNTGTKYRVGSITKMFTSVMIQQLIEEKKLKLTTPLSKFFPKVKNAKKITIQQMLQHRSGLHNYTDDYAFLLINTTAATEDQMLDLIYQLPSDFEPGEKHSYSNTNYVLLGYIIEKLTRKSYNDALKERIVDKIGLPNTYYGGITNVSNNEARSYLYTNRNWTLHPEWDMSTIHGAGAIVSTTEDLLKFVDALFAFQLLSEESVKQMCSLKDNYGYGITSIPFYDDFLIGHNGHWDAFESVAGYIPALDMTLAFSANGKNANTNDFLVAVLSICFEMPYEIPKFDKYEIPENILDDYAGTYHSDLLKMDFTIFRDGIDLSGQAVGQAAFALEAVDDFNFKYEGAGLVIEFKRNDQKSVDQFILKQAGMEYPFLKLK